jgi:N-acetyltransferase
MTFDFKPILENALVRLEPLHESDFERLYAAAADPLIWEQHPNKSRYQRDVFKENYFDSGIAEDSTFLALDKVTGEVIGSSRFYNLEEQHSEIEIGWTFIKRSHWGGNYNKAMKDVMLRHAFQFVDNVIFVVGENNLRSQMAVKKIGGVQVFHDDNPHFKPRLGSIFFRIKKQDFKGLNY